MKHVIRCQIKRLEIKSKKEVVNKNNYEIQEETKVFEEREVNHANDAIDSKTKKKGK
jgi:hypothetical protein